MGESASIEAPKTEDAAMPDPVPPTQPAPTIGQLFSPGYILQLFGQFGLGGVFAGALLLGMNKWHEEDRQDRLQQQAEIRSEMRALTTSIDQNSKAAQDLAAEIRRTRQERP